ncbi:hypothetical protein [Agrobacterium tumefaciens]|uniref:Uncharacterized protein n=1 Tax=Agrobacterium tumefaciens TaxID=358 RepID=A0AA44F8Q1_AGRTU|nr:hypothetical protein [Agrobacterium tumefaciens]NTB86858.1 hypothetical protein [Agrobacterium tumefaciens]NTC21187.1 hypothetical protein [Agrobacterium tumefaciens]NTC30735.1 hypothetical protein [Agrobacterium tumefaciens]
MIRKVDDAQDAIDTYGRFRNQILDVLSLSGDISEAELLNLLDERHAVMITDDESIAIAQIITHDDKVWCLIRIASGKLENILSGFEFVADWSKNFGAIGMCLEGRKGWKRVLSILDFRDLAINTNKNKNIEKAGLYLLGKYYGIITKDDDPNYTD